jgi:hypothetical protein
MTGVDRIIGLLGALVAVAVVAIVLRPVADSRAEPRIQLARASGDVRMDNSKLGAAILGSPNWRPGQRVTGKVAIANTGGGAARVALTANGIVDRAGIGGGRLSRATRVRVVRMRPIIHGRETVFSGRLTRLRRVAVGAWPAGGTRYFRLSATLTPPRARAANDFQAAQLSFGFVWTAAADEER